MRAAAIDADAAATAAATVISGSGRDSWEDVEAHLWAHLLGRAPFAKLGRRTSLCRFGAAQAKLLECQGTRAMELLEAWSAAIELGMVSDRRVLTKLTAKPGPQEGLEEQGTTSCKARRP